MATASSVFANPPLFLSPTEPHHHLPQRTTFLCTIPVSSQLYSLSLSRLHRRCFTPKPIITASLKQNLGLVSKTWSDFTSLNYWVVRDYYRLVSSVNAFEPQIQRLSDEQLTAKTAEFRERLAQGERLADIQAEAFAVVREAARRKLGMRHFDVQVIGGAVLHDGSIAEMKTGEGKTLVSTLAAYLNALTGEGVHVVTVNDYLAQRDAEWMGRVHRFLGLSVGLIQKGMTAEERRSNYKCDITYTNNSELGFDYLRDNLAGSSGQLVMRWPKPFHFAIVDEVDSVLIDEGRNPLLISGEASKDAARYPVAAKVADLLLQGLHYNAELKDNSVELTEEGIALAEMALETNDLWDENDPWASVLPKDRARKREERKEKKKARKEREEGREMAMAFRDCYCGNMSHLKTSWTDTNPGRRFIACEKIRGHGGCGFFQWYDPPMCQRSKGVIPGLLKHLSKVEQQKGVRRKRELLPWALLIGSWVFFIYCYWKKTSTGHVNGKGGNLYLM